MMGRTDDQGNLLLPQLNSFIDMKNELVLLADKINWKHLEQELAVYYSKRGRRSMPVRFMVGCLILKQLHNLGDETLAAVWNRDPYFQYFTGEIHFQHQFPCDPSDLVHFRNRLGETGIKKVFELSVKMNEKEACEKVVVSDTTVQGNYITFPTDGKMYKKVIDTSNRIAKEEGVIQRQSYKKTSKILLRQSSNRRSASAAKIAKKATRKLKTLAGRQVRELERKLNEASKQKHQVILGILKRVITQEKRDSDKVYSIHKPFTACIAKGKSFRPYEFGNKIGLVVTAKSQVIIAIKSFPKNIHDSKTIESLLVDMKERVRRMPEELVYDRAGRGKKEIEGVKILTPGKPHAGMTKSDMAKMRRRFRRRAAIEPVIGHLKTDHRMAENYLHGESSPQLNAYLAATAWNLKKAMKKLVANGIFVLDKIWHFFFGSRFVLALTGNF